MDKLDINRYAVNYARSIEKWAVEEIYKDFTLQIKLDWSPKRRSSRGGIYAAGPGINIAMAHCWPTDGLLYRFYEYKSFDADKNIGGFYSSDSTHKLEAVILHEIAHALQFTSYKKNNIRCKPHGPIFKNFYKRLRTEFLNHKLPDQKIMEKEYSEYLDKLFRKSARR